VQAHLEPVSSFTSDARLGMFQSPPVTRSVVTQQRWFKSYWQNRTSTVCASTGSRESSRFVPRPTTASSKTDVTSGREQGLSRTTSIRRTQTQAAHVPKHHCSPRARPRPPNLGASGLSPQPWFRDQGIQTQWKPQ